MFILKVNKDIMLRMLSARDAEPLYQNIEKSRSYLRKWVSWIDETNSVTDSRAFIKNSFYTYAEHESVTAGIFYKDHLVGIISFTELDWKNRIGYLGYWLAKDYQGYGIMTRSVSALIDYGFHEYELNRIDIRVADKNLRSRAIPERLKFTKEGKIRQAEWINNNFIDHVVYGILKSQWTDSHTLTDYDY